MSSVGTWEFIAFDEVLAIHRDAIVSHGGQDGPPQPGCVEGKIGGAITSAGYEAGDDEPDLLCAVGYLIVYLVLGHCFTDGNKRAAWAAAVRVLDANGIRVNCDDPEAAPLIERVATHDADVSDVIAWLGRAGRLRAAPSQMERLKVAPLTLDPSGDEDPSSADVRNTLNNK